MYKCLFCGMENINEKARFCTECGPEGPSSSWSQSEVDCGDKVDQYASIFSDFYFGTHSEIEIGKFSSRLRERLKISYAKHVEVLSKLSEKKKEISHLSNFRFEFNENVTDAFAGHDTFLDFRYTNLSQYDAFKVSLLWGNPEAKDRVDLRVETKNFVKPLASVNLGCSAIFSRIGIKEISDLRIIITDQIGESASFIVEPFRFKVGSHEQRITQHISTHNQISMERGVIDASGMGVQKGPSQPEVRDQPKWIELKSSYLQREIGQLSSNFLAETDSDSILPSIIKKIVVSVSGIGDKEFDGVFALKECEDWLFLNGSTLNSFLFLDSGTSLPSISHKFKQLIERSLERRISRITYASALEVIGDMSAMITNLNDAEIFLVKNLEELVLDKNIFIEYVKKYIPECRLPIQLDDRRIVYLDLPKITFVAEWDGIRQLPDRLRAAFDCLVTVRGDFD